MHAADQRVTIILPTYNRAGYLGTSLDSLLAQTARPAQVIVVDDGSTDGTQDVLRAYQGSVQVVTRPNGGKPAAINAALPLVAGEFIWVFDDDDIACEDALARHVAAFDTHPDAAFTYGGCVRFHDDPMTGARVVESTHPVRPFDDEEYLLELMLSSYVASPAVMVRSAVQRAVGEYRDEITRSEDFEIALRWGLHGRGVRLADPRPAYWRRTHAGLRGAAADRFAPGERVARERGFERRILTDLDGQLDLRHHLPCSAWSAPLDGADEVRARLRRWTVSMQKGLWRRAGEDLAWLADRNLTSTGCRADLATVVPRAVRDKYALAELLAEPAAAAMLARLLGRAPLRPVAHALARQFYHLARHETACRDWPALALTLRAAWRLLGRAPRALLGEGGA